MSDEKKVFNDGGQAFPRPAGPYIDGEGLTNQDELGMSLREWFAGMERSELPASMCEGIRTKEQLAEKLAEWRFLCADAMLSASAKKGNLGTTPHQEKT